MAVPDDFQLFYKRYAPVAHRRALRLLRSEAEAEDVVHELFASLYARPEQFRGESAPSTFIYRATTNACLKQLRDSGNRERLIRLHASAAPRPTQATSADTPATLRAVLNALPPPLGALAVYYYVDELTHAEIAEMLDCSRRQVGHLLQRMRGELEKLQALEAHQ